jgi:hypothetical protein
MSLQTADSAVGVHFKALPDVKSSQWYSCRYVPENLNIPLKTLFLISGLRLAGNTQIYLKFIVHILHMRPGWSRYRTSLGTGRFGYLILAGSRFFVASRQAARHTQSLIQWLPGLPGINRPERDADHKPPRPGAVTLSPICA